LVGKKESAPCAAMPENSDPSGSCATVILNGQRVRLRQLLWATADESQLQVIRVNVTMHRSAG
jgi:hypothetical protein